MDILLFVSKIEEQYSEVEQGSFNIKTKFKEMPEWGSLTALMIVAMVDQELNKSLNGDIINSSTTIEDLYNNIIAQEK